MQKQAKITSKAQITVPREVRRYWVYNPETSCCLKGTRTAYGCGRSGPQAHSRRIEELGTRESALERKKLIAGLVICASVLAELLAAPGRTEAFLTTFFEETGIRIDWDLEEEIWRVAGRAFQKYAARRKKQGDPGPRRILADFLIGAHASEHGYRLLTLDEHLYRAAFPGIATARV